MEETNDCPCCGMNLSEHSKKELVTCAMSELDTAGE